MPVIRSLGTSYPEMRERPGPRQGTHVPSGMHPRHQIDSLGGGHIVSGSHWACPSASSLLFVWRWVEGWRRGSPDKYSRVLQYRTIQYTHRVHIIMALVRMRQILRYNRYHGGNFTPQATTRMGIPTSSFPRQFLVSLSSSSSSVVERIPGPVHTSVLLQF